MVSSKSVSNAKSSSKRGAGFGHSSKSEKHRSINDGDGQSDSKLDEEKDSPDGAEQIVVVTLLLAGGHEYQLVLDQDAPPLKQLFSVLMDSPEKRRSRLFQLPVHTDSEEDEDRTGPEAALCFTGDRLVGIITDPPIYIQQPQTQQPDTDPERSTQPQTGYASTSTANSTHYTVIASPERESTLAAGVIPSRYIQLTNFLDSDLHRRILDYAVTQESAFVGSSTSTGDLDYRQSSVLHHFPEFSDIMQGEIHRAFADVIASLKLNPFNITQVEAQLTAHNDGHYYKVHNDNGSEDTATRVLTYVYYFYQDPKPFSGGELRIYDSRIQNNYYVQAESLQDITPLNNSIVFFPSHYMHEVLPIVCPSRQFADSRFTINGWVRR